MNEAIFTMFTFFKRNCIQKVFLIVVLFILFNQSITYSQYPDLICGMNGSSSGGGCYSYTLPFFPMQNDTLKALVVFCNFLPPEGNFELPGTVVSQYWPASQSQVKPSWADSIICPTTTNVWNKSLTGLYRDASLGKFWLIGDVYPTLYIFQQNTSYYADPSRRIGFAVKELLENINATVNFADYDKFDPYDIDADGNKREKMALSTSYLLILGSIKQAL